MSDLDFLTDSPHPCGDATITIIQPDSTIVRIAGVSPSVIAEKCPLLCYAFEDGADGSHQACVESTSEAGFVRLLRFLYTDNYLTLSEQDVPQTSLLAHVEVYKLARDFDVPELQVSAYCNLTRETELGCSLPQPPQDLSKAIRFVYDHLKSEETIIETLLNYCVFAFRYHGLGANEDFRQAAFDIPDFHRALCKVNFKRNFEDDGAPDIVAMSACRAYDRPLAPFDMDQRTQAEFQYAEWFDSETSNLSTDLGETSHREKRRRTDTDTFSIVRRPKCIDPAQLENEQLEIADGFALVHRPTADHSQDDDCASEQSSSDTETITSDCERGISDLEQPQAQLGTSKPTIDELYDAYIDALDHTSPLINEDWTSVSSLTDSDWDHVDDNTL